MSLRNRLLRIFNQDIEDRAWKRLSVVCAEDLQIFRQSDSRKIILEQKLEKTNLKSRVNFNKLVEVNEFFKPAPSKISKLGELTSIAMDLKKE
jgi:hypothetical protein